MIVPLMRVIQIIVPLGFKNHALSKLSIAIECFNAINNISRIHCYGFASNVNIVGKEAGAVRQLCIYKLIEFANILV